MLDLFFFSFLLINILFGFKQIILKKNQIFFSFPQKKIIKKHFNQKKMSNQQQQQQQQQELQNDASPCEPETKMMTVLEFIKSKSFIERKKMVQRQVSKPESKDKNVKAIFVYSIPNKYSESIELTRQRYLVPGDLTFTDLMVVIRKNLKVTMDPQEALFLWYNPNMIPDEKPDEKKENPNENENENENVKTKQKMKQGETIQPAMNMMVKEFHRSYHHIDDILYLGIMREVTFGGRCVCK